MTRIDEIPGVLRRHDPSGLRLPLVFDSPHSGTAYPDDFRHAAPRDILRTAEDTHVAALFAAAPAHGAPLLEALFPRSYIDANRDLADIDPSLLADRWPGELAPGEKSRLGLGLIRKLARPGVPVYDRKLTATEIKARIDAYYLPYHRELQRLLDGAHRRHGVVFHVNCHSMASKGGAMTPDGAVRRADFVLGDRDGTTCTPEFVAIVAEALGAAGYDVRINDPYKGAELVRRYADPAKGRHSLQIEINRRLYMDEKTRARNANFAPLEGDLTRLVARIADYCRGQCG
ncbi:MAG TPA: N-formylglutamate amidohydrolase [Alphaproteobacteria bacterium]|nr:N-formylglutamate amidohydrolase [Alphaproteobacteria bacterium]